MSLASLAVRLATIRALKGRTYAGENVFDSKMQPLDLVAVTGGFEFVIIVTTDDDTAEIEGRDLRAGDHKLELVIEVAATAKLTVEAEEGGMTEVLTVPSSDAGLEASINIIGWQIMRALTADGGEWGDLWRGLVVRVHEVASKRGADEANGVRYAARQWILKLDHIAEPEPGVTPASGDLWGRTVAMMKDDPEFAAIGKIIETTITADQPEPWERVRALLGLANDASGWIADRPFEDADTLSGIDLTDGFAVDEQTAADADGPETGA